MSKELLGAVSAVALFAGAAVAQDAGPGATPTRPPPPLRRRPWRRRKRQRPPARP